MLTLNAYGNKTPCVNAVKDKNSIAIHLPDGDIRIDSGITDFSGYTLTDEDGNPVEFSAPEPTEADRLRALESAMLAMMMGGMTNA